jgi:hypothetical protein
MQRWQRKILKRTGMHHKQLIFLEPGLMADPSATQIRTSHLGGNVAYIYVYIELLP